MSSVALDIGKAAREMREAQDGCRQIEPFTSRLAGFDLDAGYEVARRVHGARVAAGERPLGRKVGFTNPAIWDTYNVHAPIWGHMYESTTAVLEEPRATCPMRGLAEPRIEPEIVFRFRSAPRPGASPGEILDAIVWVAHGFEIVQSHFPGWKFRAPDTVADRGLHGRLFVGPPQPLASLGASPAEALASFAVSLACDGQPIDRGRGSNVIGSPLGVIGHLVAVLAAQGKGEALRAGEIVTTGTLTAAWPVRAGQVWTTTIEGVALPGFAIRFTG